MRTWVSQAFGIEGARLHRTPHVGPVLISGNNEGIKVVKEHLLRRIEIVQVKCLVSFALDLPVSGRSSGGANVIAGPGPVFRLSFSRDSPASVSTPTRSVFPRICNKCVAVLLRSKVKLGGKAVHAARFSSVAVLSGKIVSVIAGTNDRVAFIEVVDNVVATQNRRTLSTKCCGK